MKGQARMWIGVALAAVLALAGWTAAAYVPLFLWARNGFTDPLTISPAQAYRFARAATAAFGGLPPDARLAGTGGLGVTEFHGSGHAMSYGFIWRPRDNPPAFADVDDILVAEVVSEARATCLRADCSAYTVTYRPRLQMFMRSWHPAWWRAWLQRRIRESASFVPAPTFVRTSCPGGVDVRALRRVIGNSRHYLTSGGMHYPVPDPAAELAIPGTTIARFPAANIAQAHADNAIATAALASDAAPKNGRYRVVWLLVANPWPWQRQRRPRLWLQFASDDLERTCKGALTAQPEHPLAFSDRVLAPDALAGDAVYRSTEEARRRTHNAPYLRNAQLLSLTESNGGTIVRTRHDDGAAAWIGTFTYDVRGALTQALYQRREITPGP